VYPYLRVFRLAIKSLFQKKKHIDWRAEFHTSYRPFIGDLDVYPEVNNGRHFVLFDMARYDLAFAIGLVKYVRKNRLAFVVGGSSIRYRKRLAPFRKIRIRTQLVGLDEKFFYFQHTTEQSGAVCSSALVRTALRKKGGTALPIEVMTALGFEANTFMQPWVQDWADWDDQRPWPEFSSTE
jgi:acyl-CoA thioesterase FadM